MTEMKHNLDLRNQLVTEFSPAPYVAGMVTYSAMAVRSLYVLCGGALFVFPALLGASKEVAIGFASGAGAAFLVGLLFAAVTTFLGYFNFSLTIAERVRMIDYLYSLDATQKLEGQAYLTRYDLLEADWGQITKMRNGLTWTSWVGVATCTVGYLSFVYGCYLSAMLIEGLST